MTWSMLVEFDVSCVVLGDKIFVYIYMGPWRINSKAFDVNCHRPVFTYVTFISYILDGIFIAVTKIIHSLECNRISQTQKFTKHSYCKITKDENFVFICTQCFHKLILSVPFLLG